MKIKLDKDANAAYIYIEDEIKPGESVKTIEVNEDIILDFNEDNKLIGIEVLNAKENLTSNFLSKNIIN